MLGKVEGRRRRGHQKIKWWTASQMQRTWTWANSRRWWGTGRPSMLLSMRSQRVGHNWVTEQQKSILSKSVCTFNIIPIQIAMILFPDIKLVQFSCSVVSNSLRPHESQHARPPCPLPTPGVHSDSHPSSQWCHPAISSSVVPFSSCPQSLPASESSNESTLWMRWPKYWSFSFRIIPSKELPGLISFRMDWLDLLAVQRTLKSLLQHHSSKASIIRRSALNSQQSHTEST